MAHSFIAGSRARIGFFFAIPIAILGGLIGLGGAEFRLPVLVGPLRYTARQAVPLNLSVSLCTIVAAFVVRSRTTELSTLNDYVVVMVSLIAGALVTAFLGPAIVMRISDVRLERLILILLVAIGIALLVESVGPDSGSGFVPGRVVPQVLTGLTFGLGIGLVSSLLGVAGGEVIIPTLLFAYGLDIKIAGTASLLISLPTVTLGIIRYARRGAIARPSFRGTIVPMGAGSIIGAVIGGALLGIIPAGLLKFGLGVILIVSAIRIFGHRKGV
jgi:uncharacterized protein